MTLRVELMRRLKVEAGISPEHFGRLAHEKRLVAPESFFRSEDDWSPLITWRNLGGKSLHERIAAVMLWASFIEATEYLEHVAKHGSMAEVGDAALFAGELKGIISARQHFRELRQLGATKRNETRRSASAEFVAEARRLRARLEGGGRRSPSTKEVFFATAKTWRGSPPIGLKTFYRYMR